MTTNFSNENNSLTRLLAERAKPIDASEFIEHAHFGEVYSSACMEFLGANAHDHYSFSEQRQTTANLDAKKFFIHKAVFEVLKATVSKRVWCKQIVDVAPVAHASYFRSFQPFADAIHNQQNLSIRKLFETLVYCLLFSKTNTQHSYEHLLLLFELEQMLGRIQDKEEFFGQVSAFEKDLADTLRKDIEALEAADTTLLNAWYFKSTNPNPQRLMKRPILASMKTLYNMTRTVASPAVRAALGSTYQVVFGSTSKWVHFTPSRIYSSGPVTLFDIARYMSLQSSLSNEILLQCMELSDSVPGAVCQLLKRTRVTDVFIDDAVEQILLKSFEVGSFVTYAGTLFKVLESYTSAYGLISCRLQPLAGQYQNTDWFPSSDLTLFSDNNVAAEHDVIAEWHNQCKS